jgi:hypothetical protein
MKSADALREAQPSFLPIRVLAQDAIAVSKPTRTGREALIISP